MTSSSREDAHDGRRNQVERVRRIVVGCGMETVLMATAFVRVLFFALTLKLLAALTALPYSPCRTCHIENLAFSQKNITKTISITVSHCAIALVAVGWHLTC